MADWGSIIQAGASLLNTGSQIYTNAKNRQWALQDWNMQNAYNDPKQQMQRFKEAGLNPNLVYSQMSNGPAVRSTDAIAPKLDAEQLNVLKHSNQFDIQKYTIDTMKNTIEGQRLENDNKRIQNEILEKTKNDLMDKPSIQNRIGNANYDNLIEQVNLKRLERSQYPIKTDILAGQLKSLATSNEYQRTSLQQKYDINELLKKNMNQIIESQGMNIDLQKMDVQVRKELNEILNGLGSGVAGKVMEFLGKAALLYMGKSMPTKTIKVPK